MKLKLLRDPEIGIVGYFPEYGISSWKLWLMTKNKGSYSYHSLGASKDGLCGEKKWIKLI